MKELETITKEFERMKKKIEELEEEKAQLEYEVMLYNTDRKTDLCKEMNELEKMFIEFLEEVQQDYCYNDCEMSRYKLNNYDMMIDQFYEKINEKINEKKIKQYFEFDRWHK